MWEKRGVELGREDDSRSELQAYGGFEAFHHRRLKMRFGTLIECKYIQLFYLLLRENPREIKVLQSGCIGNYFHRFAYSVFLSQAFLSKYA